MIYEKLAANLLEEYKIAKSLDPAEIKNLKVHKAQRYALSKIIDFHYKSRKFYIIDDYSIDDNPALVKEIIQDINHLVKGIAVKNPVPQSDGTQYALGLDGMEYYLWEDN